VTDYQLVFVNKPVLEHEPNAASPGYDASGSGKLVVLPVGAAVGVCATGFDVTGTAIFTEAATAA
jgi:hypothetical protein